MAKYAGRYPNIGVEALVLNALLGDLEAFDELVSRFRGAVILVAMQSVGSREAAEDLAQETFLLAFKALPQLQEPAHFGGWLCTIARHRAIRFGRQETRQEPTEDSKLDTLLLRHSPALTACPETALLRKSDQAELRTALATLEPEFQIVLQLRYFEEWPLARIADFLSLPLTTIKWRLHRGKALLRRSMTATEENTNGPNRLDPLEIRRIRRLLRETVKLAEHASLTGSLDKGSRIAIRQYNHIREHLEDTGLVPEDLFQELDEDETTFDELGVACGMLDGYLEEDDEPVEVSGKNQKKVQVNMVGLKELEDLKEIGKIIRESLPEFLRGRGLHGQIEIDLRRTQEHSSTVSEEPARHEETSVATPPTDTFPAEMQAEQRAQQMHELTSQIREVGQQLRNPELSSAQREELLLHLDNLMQRIENGYV